MIQITPTIAIDEGEIREDFICASGPGGQNVNKVATAVQLRFDVTHCSSLPEEVRQRLARLAGRRMTEEGVLIIEARRFRTQARNRQDAFDRMVILIRKAAEQPKIRRKTRPPAKSREQRLKTKRRRSQLKEQRRSIQPDEE